MEKKLYISPEVEVLHVMLEGVLAGSGDEIKGGGPEEEQPVEAESKGNPFGSSPWEDAATSSQFDGGVWE